MESSEDNLQSGGPQINVNLGSGLIPLNLLVVVLVLGELFFPSDPLRIILGIPCLLFIPGYALVTALFVKKHSMSGVERLTLSIILSIVVVMLIGFFWDFSFRGIRLDSVGYSVMAFIILASAAAWFRRRRLDKFERFQVRFEVALSDWGTGLQKAITVFLVISVLGALGALGYYIALPHTGETFTEFYILNQEGISANFTSELKVGEEGRVIVGIINHEGAEVTYRVDIVLGDNTTRVYPEALADRQKWEGEVRFIPQSPEPEQKVRFLLFRDNEPQPFLEPLMLSIHVTE